ncbi:unnamed protein product [Cylicostephanus goldi]|uniref:Uncharacterized protein n=1 Tax=Cylicostephanus goldi TaxID=71465 RepID=A0A3P6QRP4_CYLGO|nr:unnamed protein product [Cylicostephanus goldi]
MYWLPYAVLVLLTILALCSADRSPSEESDAESSTEIPLSSIFSVGKKLCKPRFSEISTLYLGIDAQDNRNEFDEFLELDFPPRQCQNVKSLVISKYTVIVLDTRPSSAALLGSLFYGKLHQNKMRTNSRHFVIGNRSEASRSRRPFDIAFTHSKGNALVNCISKEAFAMEDFQPGRVMEQNRALRIAHVADYPVVFVLVENPPASAREDYLRMQNLQKTHPMRRL